MDAGGHLQKGPRSSVFPIGTPVGERSHRTGELSVPVRFGQLTMSFRHFTLLKLHRPVTQHKMGKVEVKFMRRHIGTLGQKTHVAKRAGIDDRFKIFTIHGIQLAGIRVINEIKKPGKRVAQVEAATTPVANIENPSKLSINSISGP